MQLSRHLRAFKKHGYGRGKKSDSGVVEVDHVAVSVRGGTGGGGYRPVGGIGGRGGDVIFVAREKMSMVHFARTNPTGRIVANNGVDSRKLVIYGAKGKDREVPVPRGVTISLESGKKVAELDAEGEELVVAEGGQGGGPYNNFKPVRPPTTLLNLDIKLLADIGFVGYPNAGKSTLLKGLSRTNPAISAFPFTTVKPQIGTIVYPDLRRISVADLPGLIEGAYRNVGMGHRFLKHVERTRVLLLVLDVFGFQLNQESPFRTPLQALQLLNRELELYDPALLDKPAALVLNKVDLPSGMSKARELAEFVGEDGEVDYGSLPASEQLEAELMPQLPLRFGRVFTTSAVRKKGLERCGIESYVFVEEDGEVDYGSLPASEQLEAELMPQLPLRFGRVFTTSAVRKKGLERCGIESYVFVEEDGEVDYGSLPASEQLEAELMPQLPLRFGRVFTTSAVRKKGLERCGIESYVFVEEDGEVDYGSLPASEQLEAELMPQLPLRFGRVFTTSAVRKKGLERCGIESYVFVEEDGEVDYGSLPASEQLEAELMPQLPLRFGRVFTTSAVRKKGLERCGIESYVFVEEDGEVDYGSLPASEQLEAELMPQLPLRFGRVFTTSAVRKKGLERCGIESYVFVEEDGEVDYGSLPASEQLEAELMPQLPLRFGRVFTTSAVRKKGLERCGIESYVFVEEDGEVDYGSLPASEQLEAELMPQLPLRFGRVFTTSAVRKKGLERLKTGLREMLDEVEEERLERRRAQLPTHQDPLLLDSGFV